jgi:anti-sigma B factor antagonist
MWKPKPFNKRPSFTPPDQVDRPMMPESGQGSPPSAPPPAYEAHPPEQQPGYEQSSEPATPQAAGAPKRPETIAEIERIGKIAVATLTVTELSQEVGAEQLSSLLHELAETGAQHFILDVQNVQYMDTACLGCLVEALNRLSATGGRIAMVNPNHSVHYIFRLTRLDRVFRICNDVPSAMQAVDESIREAG